jgi:hypothetical protein
MKRLLVTGLGLFAMAAGVMGCNECEKARDLSATLSQRESILNEYMQNPTKVGSSDCSNFIKWQANLEKESNFAYKVAREQLSWIEYKCDATRFTTHCDIGDIDGRHSHPGVCHRERECAHYRKILHKREGYDEAIYVGSLLSDARFELAKSCSSNFMEAFGGLASAKRDITLAQYNLDEVYKKYGCVDQRSGD